MPRITRLVYLEVVNMLQELPIDLRTPQSNSQITKRNPFEEAPILRLKNSKSKLRYLILQGNFFAKWNLTMHILLILQMEIPRVTAKLDTETLHRPSSFDHFAHAQRKSPKRLQVPPFPYQGLVQRGDNIPMLLRTFHFVICRFFFPYENLVNL